MIITLKTLLQQTFTIDADEEMTIKDLKKRVNEERGADFPAESLNLIYSGAIMKDEEQIKDYKIDSKKFIVVMKKKEKVEATPSVAAPAVPVTAPVVAADAASTADAKKEEVKQPTDSAPSTAVAAASSQSADNEAVIRNMMELGYPRPLVEAALRLSYNNPDIACEYLISERITEANMNSVEADNLALGGVREELMDLVDAYDNSRNQPGGNPENEPLAFLRSQPQFHQMRQEIQANPQFLNTVLQQIGVNNPGLLKLISENQSDFVKMINEPLNNNDNIRDDASAAVQVAAGAEQMDVAQADPPAGGQELDLTANDDLLAATLAGGDDEEDEEPQQANPDLAAQPGQRVLQVELPDLTDADRAAILRIREISGFPEIDVIQAYIACGRDEELALNFLFTD